MEVAGKPGPAQSNLVPTALLGVCALGLSLIALVRSRNRLRSESLLGRRTERSVGGTIANNNNTIAANTSYGVSGGFASAAGNTPSGAASRAAHRRRSTNEAAAASLTANAASHSEDTRRGTNNSTASAAEKATSLRTPDRTMSSSSTTSVQKSSYYTTRAQLHVQHHSVHLLRWADEVLGLSFSFSPLLFQLIREERQAPLIVLTLSYLRQPSHRVSLAIEAMQQQPHLSAERYREMSLEKISACAELLATSSTRVGSAQCPQAEYRYVDEHDELLYVLAMFITHGTLAVTVQYTAPTRVRNVLPTAFYELVRSLQFIEPATTPSYLLVSEPRLGLGFRLPLDFTVHDEPITTSTSAGSTNVRYTNSSSGGGNDANVYRYEAEEEENDMESELLGEGRTTLHGPFRPFARALRRGTQRMGLMACYEPPVPRAVHELNYSRANDGSRLTRPRQAALPDAWDGVTRGVEGTDLIVNNDSDDDSVHQRVPSNEEEENDIDEEDSSWSTSIARASFNTTFSPVMRRQELLQRYLQLRVRAALIALGLRQGLQRPIQSNSDYRHRSRKELEGLPRVVLREGAEGDEHGASDTVADRDLDGVFVLRPFMLRRQAHGNFARDEDDVSESESVAATHTQTIHTTNTPSTARTSSPALLRGYFGMTRVTLRSPRSVCWSMMCDDADCLVCNVSTSELRRGEGAAAATVGQETTRTVTKSCLELAKEGTETGLVTAYYAVFFLLLDELCVSVHFLVREARHAFTELVGFCTSTMRTVTLGNHYGQHSSVLYCNIRHDILPFRLTLSTAHAVVEEPTLGDPLAVLYDVYGMPIIIRAFPLVIAPHIKPPVSDVKAKSEAGPSLSVATSSLNCAAVSSNNENGTARRHHRAHHLLAHTMRAYLQDLGEQVRVLQWRIHTLNAQPAVSVLFTTCATPLITPTTQPLQQQSQSQRAITGGGGVYGDMTQASARLIGVTPHELPLFGSLVSPPVASLPLRSPHVATTTTRTSEVTLTRPMAERSAGLVSRHVCGDVCSTAALSEVSLAPSIQSQQEVELEEVGTGNPLAQYDARAAQLRDRALLALEQQATHTKEDRKATTNTISSNGNMTASAQGIYVPYKASEDSRYRTGPNATNSSITTTLAEPRKTTLPTSFFSPATHSREERLSATLASRNNNNATTTTMTTMLDATSAAAAMLRAGDKRNSSSAQARDAHTSISQYYFHDRRAGETTLWGEMTSSAAAAYMSTSNHNEEDEEEVGEVRVAVAVCSEGHAFVLLANASMESAERVQAEVQSFATRLVAMPRTT